MVATADRLIARASEQTGLTRLGPDGWQEGLDRLLGAVAVDIDDPVAVASIEDLLVARLVIRLRIEEWYARHGDEAAQPVSDLLVIVGLPRTATTALHHLLSLDPQFRYLRHWELRDPVPPPDLITDAADPRRPVQPPAGSVRHITAVDGPAEDGNIHTWQFRHGEISLPLPTYTRWWLADGHGSIFAYHERILRMLHAHRPPYRWLLKFPSYLFSLPELVAHYPGARFVMTHRDPVVVVPSTCSVVQDSRQQRVPSWSPGTDFGAEVLSFLASAMEHALLGRAALGEDRFVDVGQSQLEDDPVGTAERVYAFAGLELAPDVRRAMTAWAADNRRGARGPHQYSAAQFGLADEEIRRAFAAYTVAFPELTSPP